MPFVASLVEIRGGLGQLLPNSTRLGNFPQKMGISCSARNCNEEMSHHIQGEEFLFGIGN